VNHGRTTKSAKGKNKVMWKREEQCNVGPGRTTSCGTSKSVMRKREEQHNVKRGKTT